MSGQKKKIFEPTKEATQVPDDCLEIVNAILKQRERIMLEHPDHYSAIETEIGVVASKLLQTTRNECPGFAAVNGVTDYEKNPTVLIPLVTHFPPGLGWVFEMERTAFEDLEEGINDPGEQDYIAEKEDPLDEDYLIQPEQEGRIYPDRRLKWTDLTIDILSELLRGDLDLGDGYSYRTDAPDDLAVLEVQQDFFGRMNGTIRCICWSASFPEIVDGEEIPQFFIGFSREKVEKECPLSPEEQKEARDLLSGHYTASESKYTPIISGYLSRLLDFFEG